MSCCKAGANQQPNRNGSNVRFVVSDRYAKKVVEQRRQEEARNVKQGGRHASTIPRGENRAGVVVAGMSSATVHVTNVRSTNPAGVGQAEEITKRRQRVASGNQQWQA